MSKLYIDCSTMMNFLNFNEADIRETVIAPLIQELGYRSGTEHGVRRELSLRYPKFFIGRKAPSNDPALRGRADYILDAGGVVRWVIEAKPPTCVFDIDDLEQAWTYASHPEVRAVYFVLCNGKHFQVYQTNRGADAAPILSVTYEDLIADESRHLLHNLLSPTSVLRDHPKREIDFKAPLATGLRSTASISSGFISYEKSSAAIPALTQLQISITGGSIARDSENRLVVSCETRAPLRSVQDFNESFGLNFIEMISGDFFLSGDSKRPTAFFYSSEFVFPAGHELLDMNSWKMVTFPEDMVAKVNAVAVGALEGNRFQGSFFNEMLINDLIPIALEGRFSMAIV